MSFIRTTLGDVDAAALGRCYAHEHLIIDAGYAVALDPDFMLDSVDAASRELAALHAAGGGAVVDSMPCACGRNVLKLAEASRRSGVHVVAPTGLHLAKYYPPGHWSERIDVDDLAALFVADIVTGIDANDYNGPILARAAHRAGVIKVAAGGARLADREERTFRAAAAAHRATGAPILTHTEAGAGGLEQVALLDSLDVDLSHVVLSHTDRRPEVPYHRDLLQTGVCLEYDSAFRWSREDRSNPTLDLLLALLPEFPRQLMLGMDAARRRYWTSYGGGPGLTFLLTTFTDRMRDADIADALIDRVFIANPAAAFAFSQGNPA